MGRHSIPDPDDHSDGEPAWRTDAGAGDHGDHPGDDGYETDGYRADEDEADDDETGYHADDYDEPAYGADDHHDAYSEQPEPVTEAFASSSPSNRSSSSGRQHGNDWDGGEWTGSHRAIKAGRRGVSVGVIVALVTVVAVVGGVIAWRFFGDALSHRTEAGAARCVAG